MIKLIGLMRAKPDLPLAELKRMYEEEHVPLVLELMPMVKGYRRNYLSGSADCRPFDTRVVGFDVLTELWLDSDADVADFRRRMLEGEEGRRLRSDSARFLQRGTTRLLRVEESDRNSR